MNSFRPVIHGSIGPPDTVAASASVVAPSPPAESGSLLLDTGSAVSSIDLAAASRAGLAFMGAIVELEGIGGARKAFQHSGRLYFPELDISVEGLFACYHLTETLGVLGIIGMDILSEFVLTIHGPNATVNLERP